MINLKNVKLPKSNGLEVVEVKYLPVKDIKTRNNNKNNSKLNPRIIKKENVLKFQKTLNEKKYDVEKHIPPTVDEDLNLVTGEHRYQAHILNNEQFIVVVVIRFKNFRNKKSSYWQKIWQSLENDPESYDFVALPRDKNQIIRTVVNLILNNDILNDDKEIKTALRDQNIRSENYPFYLSKIKQQISTDTSDIVDIFTEPKSELFKQFNNITNEVLSTPSNIKILENDESASVNFLQVFKKEDDNKDYDNRTFMNAVYSLQKFRNKNVDKNLILNFYAHVNTETVDKLIKVRKRKISLFDRKIKDIEKFINDYKSNKIKINFNFLKQYPNDKV